MARYLVARDDLVRLLGGGYPADAESEMARPGGYLAGGTCPQALGISVGGCALALASAAG